MTKLFQFILKSNIYYIIIISIFSLVAVELGTVWKIIPTLLLLVFLYDYNVDSKLSKTLSPLENIELTTSMKYMMRVIFPFVFCFIVLFFVKTFHKVDESEIVQNLLTSVKQTTVFVLSSILSKSLFGFIFYILFFNLILFKLSSFHFYILIFFSFSLSYLYFMISEKMKYQLNFLIILSLFHFLLLTMGNYYYIAIYKSFLSLPLEPVQKIAARLIIDTNPNLKNKKYFILNSLVFDEEDDDYDDELLTKLETIILKDKNCNKICLNLAKIIQNKPEYLNLERVGAYLNGANPTEQIYALEILRSVNEIYNINRVLQLTKSENNDVCNRAIDVLQRWGLSTPYDIPHTQTF